MLGDTLISFCLSFRRSQIYLLLAYLVLILLLPAFGLSFLKLGGGETALFAVSDTEVFLLGLVLPAPVWVQGPHGQQDMGMGIVAGRIGIVNRHVRTHAVGHEAFLNEISQQFFPLLRSQFDRQSRDKFSGQAAVLGFLVFFHGVPENSSVLPLLGSVFRQEYLLPDKAALSGVIMLYAVIIVVNSGTAQISGSRTGGTARPTAHDLCFQVIDRHNHSLPFCPLQGAVLFLLSGQKKMDGAGDA